MQKFTQKYAIIQLLEDTHEGAEYDFRAWPLHVTIADVFAIDWSVSALSSELAVLLANQDQVHTTAAADTFFGPEKQIRVTLLTINTELADLHRRVVTMLEQGNVCVQ